MRRILLSAMLLMISGTAHAAGPAQAQPTAPEATRIETDQKTGVLKIIVNGKEVARFDAKGLHVRGDVEYTGEEKETPYSDATPEPKR